MLISGFGHARTDRGVPVHLARLAPAATVVAVAMIEIVEEQVDPSYYSGQLGASELPFDFIWFTPRADLEDPCAANREQLERMKRGG